MVAKNLHQQTILVNALLHGPMIFLFL